MTRWFPTTTQGLDNDRVLCLPKWAEYGHETRKDCLAWISNVKRHNSEDRLRTIWPSFETMDASPFECYEHGDPISIYPNEFTPIQE